MIRLFYTLYFCNFEMFFSSMYNKQSKTNEPHITENHKDDLYLPVSFNHTVGNTFPLTLPVRNEKW